MNTEPFIIFLARIVDLSTQMLGELKILLEEEQYKPHQIIHSAGQVENRLWFLQTGFARTYYFDQTGKEHTLSFYLENEIIFSHKAYWKEPTDYYLEILMPTTLISLSYESLRNLEKYQETQTLIHIFNRQRFYQDLFKSRLMTWTAEERYYQFRKSCPDIFKFASVRLIASHLNMTRENLSRLMGREK